MTQIDNLTGFADQVTNLILPDGTVATLELFFAAASNRWFANVTYGKKVINAIGVCCLPNILRQWLNTLPFGIACVTADQTDPFNANDFQTGRAKLYLLSKADVAQIESVIFTAP